MTLKPTTAHETRPFDCTGKELKCEALTNAVVTSRRRLNERLNEMPRTISGVCPNHSGLIYLVGAERSRVLCRDDWNLYWHAFIGEISEVSIPNNVSGLCIDCFKGCSRLRRVTFGPSSSLDRIGASCFEETGVEEFAVPDNCRELCDRCFKGCSRLRRVTFGPSSSLERIGVEAFGALEKEKMVYMERPQKETVFTPCGLVEISIPDSVRELCEGCFRGCQNLRRVTFGPSLSLERIGASCFEETGVEEFAVPDSCRELSDRCFKGCSRLRRVTFGPSSSLERIGVEVFGALRNYPRLRNMMLCGFGEISIPDSVRELCDGCFRGCENLRRVTFGPSSSLERIGVEAFGAVRDFRGDLTTCGLVEIHIPDSVRELCDGCFKWCKSLRRVTFGPSSSLERIGVSCFRESGVEEFAVPDCVRELCERCFQWCQSLRRVTFGSSSSLERIGDYCFGGLQLVGFETPPSVRHIGSIFSTGLDQIFVRTPSGRLLTLECDLRDKIEDLKAKIFEKEGPFPGQQTLLFRGKRLENDKTLLDYNVEPGSTLHMVLLYHYSGWDYL